MFSLFSSKTPSLVGIDFVIAPFIMQSPPLVFYKYRRAEQTKGESEKSAEGHKAEEAPVALQMDLGLFLGFQPNSVKNRWSHVKLLLWLTIRFVTISLHNFY